MKLVVYIDVFFFVNFIMDFVILLFASKLLHIHSSLVRIALGSFIGATGACIILVCNELNPWLRYVFSYIVLCVLMIFCSFGFGSIRKLLHELLYVFVITIFLGGFMTFLFLQTDLTVFMQQLFGLQKQQTLTLLILVIAISILLICMPHVYQYMNGILKRGNHLYEVVISLDQKECEVKGLLDTGNHLRDPISNKPAIIVERKLMNELLTKDLTEYSTKLKVIPYRSIGKERGTMFGVVLDQMIVDVNGDKHVHKNVIACLYEGTLSSKKDYQLILHEELL